MSQRDALALAVSMAYVALVLAGALGLRRTRIAPVTLRACVHIAVGLWIIPTVMLFESRSCAMAPPVLFVIANAVGRPRKVYETLGRSGPGGWVLVFFPAAVAVVIGLWWSARLRPAVVVGVLCLGLGDSAASMVGRRWGRLRWARLLPGGSAETGAKTVEGSAALWLISTGACAGAFVLMAGWPWLSGLAAGSMVAAAGALVEAVAPGKLDNLLLPLVTSAAAAALLAWKGA